MKINLYPEMNAKIVGILRVSDEPSILYAAERIEQLEKALEFYADKENYKVQSLDVGLSPSNVRRDEGFKARQALGKE